MTVLNADAPDWAVITADTGILWNKVERRVLAGMKLKFCYLTRQWDRMTLHERAWRLVKIWPAIVHAALNIRGRIFEVSGGRSYKVQRIE